MPRVTRPFLLIECDLIRATFAAGAATAEIVRQLNVMQCNKERGRTAYQVREFFREMSLSRPRSCGASERVKRGNKTRKLRAARKDIWADFKFKQAMLAAKDSEHFVIGVVKDRRPVVIRTVHPEPFFSGCSSSSAMCAELGGKGIEFTEGV